MPITTPATNTELQADADPGVPLCPNPACRQSLIPWPYPIEHYTGPGWLCQNVAAHGGRPNTAAMWLDSEITHGPMTEAEARALELVVPWEVTR